MKNDDTVFLVICRGDSDGDYTLSTNSFFMTREEADHYLSTVSPTKDPHVVLLDGLYARALRVQREITVRTLEREHWSAPARKRG